MGMATLFFLGALIAVALDWNWLAGVTFAAGSVGAARYAHRRDLLLVTVCPPMLFLGALVLARILTAGGHLLISVAEGTLLTLASIAPWLFAGVAASLLIAVVRGLPGCIRELRRDLRYATASQPAGAARRQSRRATPQ